MPFYSASRNIKECKNIIILSKETGKVVVNWQKWLLSGQKGYVICFTIRNDTTQCIEGDIKP